VSCSIGISLFPGDGPRAKLIANADAAMYTAKRAGGACFRFFESRMDVGARELIELQRDLRLALERSELMLHYQPKIHGGSGQITGVEALVRWNHPSRGMLSPAVFIPIAERFGLIGQLGQWVIDESCRQVAAWADEGLRMRVAINLSVHQLRQDDLAERIQASMDRHAVDPSQLTFELTESAAMEDAETTLRTFERLSAIGITLSIDDFGTGYSSLSYLRRLPTQQLKIDRSFVQDLEESADARAIVNAVVRLAHALGRKVVAEGVETEGQHDILRGFGCDELQGFLFARPMPATQVSLWAIGDDTAPQEFRPSIFDDGSSLAPALTPLARAPMGR
jgi:EAL domain-containing protein (putative c-di-GMP-specific phosphodiesterase class I)